MIVSFENFYLEKRRRIEYVELFKEKLGCLLSGGACRAAHWSMIAATASETVV